MNTDKSNVAFTGRGTIPGMGNRPALDYNPDGFLEGAESERAGFSGTGETTLTDWIQLVHLGRRDAVVTVRTHDGKEGTLWCRHGDIIDAVCDGASGEDAVYQALSWPGGEVSVDFTTFEHGRQIEIATAGLIGAANEVDAGVLMSTTPTLRSERSVWKPRRPTLMLFAVAAGALAVAVIAGLLSKWIFPARPRSTPVATAVPEFVVRLEVDPTNAAILLDGIQVGPGAFKKSLPRDGRAHEVLVSAPGYVSERIAFSDVPPRQHMVLRRMQGSVAIRDVSETETLFAWSPAPAPAPAIKASGLERRRPPKMRAKPSGAISPSSAGPNPDRPRVEAPAEVHIQMIKEREPRIQMIDEHKSRIEVIQ
jgi:hypothetical protein